MSPRPRKNSISIPGLYARFDRRTSKTYYQYKNPVTGKFHGLGTDKARAEKIATTANLRITAAEAEHYLRQIDESPKAVKQRGISLKSWVERYIKIQVERKNNNDLSEIRFKEKKRMAESLASRMGTRALKDLEVRDFALLLDEWRDKGQNSAALNNRVVWVDIFKEAQHAGEVPPGWNPPEATRKPVPRVTRSRLSLEDWQIILAKTPETHYSHNAMLLAIVTGQRREDICQMKFSDIRDGYLHVEQIKTGARIAIPLALRCNAIGMSVEDVVKKCRDGFISKYLIHSHERRSSGSLGVDNLSRGFAAARDAAGIICAEGKTPTSFHEQRSLSERLYRAQGIDTKTLLGHKTQSTTDRYNDSRGQEWVRLVI